MASCKKCFGCQERYPGCQDICPDMIRAQEAVEEKTAKVRKAKKDQYEKRSYIRSHFEKVRKK